MSATGTSVLVLGDRDTFGGHFYGPADHSGPSSYATGGELIDPVSLGCPQGVQTLIPSADTTGTFNTIAVPLSSGVNVQWNLVWINIDSSAEVPATFDLSGYTTRLSAIGS